MGDIGLITLVELRQIYSQAFSDVASAERVHHETLESVEGDVRSAKRDAVLLDDDLERFIFGARSRSESLLSQASTILNNLDIALPQPSNYQLPGNVSVDELVSQVNSLLTLNQEVIQELTGLAVMLQEERRKWWKFW